MTEIAIEIYQYEFLALCFNYHPEAKHPGSFMLSSLKHTVNRFYPPTLFQNYHFGHVI